MQTHTIAQFRVIDFGMEDCSLTLRLPSANEPLEGTEPFNFNPTSALDVFRLNAPKALDVRTLSYRSRPPVAEKTAAVLVRAGEEIEITRFPCKWASLHTFELACSAGSDCLIDVWSTQNKTWGAYSRLRTGLTVLIGDVILRRALHVSASDRLRF